MTLRVVRPESEPTLDAIEARIAVLIEPIVARLVTEILEQRETFRWDWVDVNTAAGIIGITPAALRGRIKHGLVPTGKIGKRIFVDMRELDRQLREQP